MTPSISFPVERDKIYRDALEFRRLSAEQRARVLMDIISLGAAMMEESPHRGAMVRLQQAHENEWKKAQKELFARHGV